MKGQIYLEIDTGPSVYVLFPRLPLDNSDLIIDVKTKVYFKRPHLNNGLFFKGSYHDYLLYASNKYFKSEFLIFGNNLSLKHGFTLY